jgi:hypothetical protein
VSAWFSLLGQPVGDDERHVIAAYLRGLGLTEDLPVEAVTDWSGARSIVTDAAWDRRWWDAEQREKQRLWQAAVAARGELFVLQSLSRTLDSSELVRRSAAVAAERGGCADMGLIAAAAASVSEALHLAELAALAGENELHPFHLKRALFAGGRWPLGILRERYRIF